MEKTRTYRLLRGRHGRMEDGVNRVYVPGLPGTQSFIELTDEHAAVMTDCYGSRVELVDREAFEAIGKKSVDDIDIRQLSATNAVEFVKTLTDYDALVGVKAMEEDGKRRKTVLSAIELQKETLEAAEEG